MMTLRVAVNRIVSVTEARSRLSELVEDATADEFWVLTKGGKPRVALVDIAYLDDLIRRAWFNELAAQARTAFSAHLLQQGIDPEKMTEAEATAHLEND